MDDGSYSIITITIVDQLERFVKFRDPYLLISLSFRNTKNRLRYALTQSEAPASLALRA